MKVQGVPEFLDWVKGSGEGLSYEGEEFKRGEVVVTDLQVRRLIVEWLEYISRHSPRGTLMYQPDDTDVTTLRDDVKKRLQGN